jgi:hypothetical protein
MKFLGWLTQLAMLPCPLYWKRKPTVRGMRTTPKSRNASPDWLTLNTARKFTQLADPLAHASSGASSGRVILMGGYYDQNEDSSCKRDDGVGRLLTVQRAACKVLL